RLSGGGGGGVSDDEGGRAAAGLEGGREGEGAEGAPRRASEERRRQARQSGYPQRFIEFANQSTPLPPNLKREGGKEASPSLPSMILGGGGPIAGHHTSNEIAWVSQSRRRGGGRRRGHYRSEFFEISFPLYLFGEREGGRDRDCSGSS
ncbi:hypothetical protein CRG98_012874, partial [Punica granatum]